MATTRTKRSFKLNVLGLFKWESEEWTVKEVALILIMVMLFILAIIILLKVYAVPTLGGPMVVNAIKEKAAKFIKPRAP